MILSVFLDSDSPSITDTIQMRSFIQQIFTKRILQHLLAWSVVLIIEILTLLEEYYSGILPSGAVLHHLFKVLFTVFATYVNLFVLIPLFLKGRRYFLYIVFNLINLLIFSFFVFVFTVISFEDWSITEKANEHHILFTLSILYVVVFLVSSTLLHFAKEWYKLRDVASKLLLIEKEKIESEHNALKAQLNPHFLFNTLNNIYALSLAKSDDTPKVVLKLSSLMSYILYECKEERVDIQKEIDFLNDYIELEKIRSKKVIVEFVTNINATNLKIAPLIFIPFVENAFKHSKSDSENSVIKIELSVNSDFDLFFCCENNKGDRKTYIENKYKGVGIENVKKRLSLLYNENFDLRINDDLNIFRVELSMKLKHQ